MTCPPECACSQPPPSQGSLGRSFDLAAQLAPAGSSHPATEALAAIGRAVEAGGAVVVVEDLHWIDVDSAAFIDDVARQAWPTLAIVGTYRSSDLRRGAPGGDLVLRLERRNEVEHLRLDRLNRNEVGAMMAAIVGKPVSSAAVEAVTRRSGGVPFVVEELMRCADADADDFFEVQLPWSLEEAVRQQLADLTPSERVLIDALGGLRPAGRFRRADRDHRSRRGRTAGAVARPGRARCHRRATRRPAVVRPRAGRRQRAAPVAGPRAPATARALLRDARPGGPGRLRRPRPPRSRRRQIRRDRRHRGSWCTFVPRPGIVVPGTAAGVRWSGRGQSATGSARGCHRGRLAPRLPGRGPRPRASLARAGHARTVARRRDALRQPAAFRARRPDGQRRAWPTS